jgi:hypothetical protein
MLELQTTKKENDGKSVYTIDGMYYNGLAKVSISQRGTGIQSIDYTTCVLTDRQNQSKSVKINLAKK